MKVTDIALAEERQALLGSILAWLKGDSRVVAVWLAGSIGRGTHDDISDLDLWVVIADHEIDRIASDPLQFVERIVPVTMSIAEPSNAPAGGAYLLTLMAGAHGPQQVDWYWLPVSTAQRPSRTRVLFEKRPIPISGEPEVLSGEDLQREMQHAINEAILMAFITVKHIRRRDQWATARHITHLSNCIGIVEWLIERGYTPRFDDPILPALPPTIPVAPVHQIETVVLLVDRLLSSVGSRFSGSSSTAGFLVRWLDRARRES